MNSTLDLTAIHAEVRQCLLQWRDKAEKIFNRTFIMPTISLKLHGRVSGKAYYDECKISINPALFVLNKQYFFEHTIPHELAHLITFQLYHSPHRRLRPHGIDWKCVMDKLGVSPNRTHNLDISAVAQHRSCLARPYLYQCDCRYHHLTSIKHRRIATERIVYRCRHCKVVLKKA